MAMFAFAANVILVVHFCYVGFTVGGEAIILAGGLLRWGWVRDWTFRLIHLASVVLVAVEAVTGTSCPLTVWEYRLRLLAGERVESRLPFIAKLLRSIIFYDFPAWVFLAAYVAFALLVGLTFLIVAPHMRTRRNRAPDR